MKVKDVGFSIRVEHVLESLGIERVEDLCKYSAKDLLKMKHMGRASVAQVEEQLETYDLSLSKKDRTELSLASDVCLFCRRVLLPFGGLDGSHERSLRRLIQAWESKARQGIR